MIAVVNQQRIEVPDACPRAAQVQFESKVARIQKALSLVQPELIMHAFTDKKRWVNHVADPAEAHHVIIPNRLLPAVDFAALPVDKDNVPKEPVPLRVRRQGLADCLQGPRAQAVVGV